MKLVSSTSSKSFINLDFMAILMFFIILFILAVVVIDVSLLTPIILYLWMIVAGSLLIVFFSNRDEIILKIQLFIFFFSLYLFYTLLNHYYLLNFSPNELPFDYNDEHTLYTWSNYGLPYISGEKFFFDIFSVFELSEMPLHVVFTSTIAYLSILIDGINGIISQKLLSPFLGGLLSVVLYSTLRYQFSNSIFAIKATFAYSLFSAVFIYSTLLLRDIDVALAYMIFFYLFLQKHSIGNLFLIFFVSYSTVFLRPESGMVLMALSLLYVHFYVRNIHSIPLKIILYFISILLFSFVIMLYFNVILRKIIILEEVKVELSVANASADSLAVKFNKLPFGISHTVKVLFGQILPFPFFKEIGFLPYAISGIFWPFLFMMMIYSIVKKNIRVYLDEKIKYLLFIMFIVLMLMSGELLVRRMMSAYPVIYIVSLYAFILTPKNLIKKYIAYYLFVMIILNTLYYFIKI